MAKYNPVRLVFNDEYGSVRETKMFMLKNQLDIPLKTFVEQAIIEKIKKMDEGVDK